MKTWKEMLHDKQFLKTFLFLTLPIALQNLLTTGVNLLDNIMIGRLGEASIASVALANQYFFVLNLILFGLCSGCSVFTAQFLGKGDYANIRRVLWVNILTGVTVGALFMAGALAAPAVIMRIFTDDAEVVALGQGYLLIIAFSYLPTAISFAFSFSLKSTARTRLPLAMAGMSLCINGVLNYILIFGKCGAPVMGVRGAALATTITRVVEMVVTLALVYRFVPELALKLKDAMGITRDFIRRLIATASPVLANESLWGLGVCLYSLVYGRMGTDTVAAVNIAMTVEKLLNIFMFGMGNAAAVMIGREMGRSNFALGREYGKRFSIIALTAGTVIGGILILISPFILQIFTVTDHVRAMSLQVLVVIGALMVVRNYNHINIVGTLRSGGDTRFCLLLDLIGVWCISLPLVFVSGMLLHWPIAVVYVMFFGEEFFKAICIRIRMKGDRWLNNLVEDL